MKNDANKKKLERLIESIVVELLQEEEDIVTQDPLIKIFISPFTDVIKTAKGELEKTAAVGYSNFKNLTKQAAALAIPFIAPSIIGDIQEKSEQELEQRLNKINDRYAEVLKRNWDTIRGRDVWGITFMLDPTFGIANKFAMRAPYATLGALEVLTGGNPKVTELKEKARKLVQHVTPAYLSSFGGGSGGGGGGIGGGGYGGFWGEIGDMGFGGFGESINYVTEQQAQAQQQGQSKNQPQYTPEQIKKIKDKLAKAVIALKSDSAVQKSLQNSKIVQELQTGAFEAIEETLNPVLKATTYEQLESAIGPEFSKFKQELMKLAPEELKKPENLKELQQALVPQIKQAYKNVLIKQLQRISKQHPNVSEQISKLIQQINNA